MSIVLQLSDVWKSFGKVVALQGVSLRLGKGEALGLVGPNGAGKTTTIRVSLGILRRDRGEVLLFGRDPWIDPSVRKRVGVVHEKPSFIEGMKCVEWLIEVARIQGADVSEVRHVLETVGLWDARNRRIRGFSAGMRQRLALAQALLHNPELLILDEPLANLDPVARRNFIELLNRIRVERSLTMLITSHTLHELLSLTSRIAVIDRGKIVFEGGAEDVRKVLGLSIARVKCSDARKLSSMLEGRDFVREVKVVDSETLEVLMQPSARHRLFEVLGEAQKAGVVVHDVESRIPEIEELLKRLRGGSR